MRSLCTDTYARLWRGLLWVLAGVVSLIALAALVLWARLYGWMTERVQPSELSDMLAPHYRVAIPEGRGPFPTALLFHGCDGARDNMARWSDALVARGWATIIVDSNTPRGAASYKVWRRICAGHLLPGAERAGDVMTAIADASVRSFVDPQRLALIGMSHGGWSIMELLALDKSHRLPSNLARPPAALASRGLVGVRAVVLVYPWCGLANRAHWGPWAHDAEVLFLLAGDDTVAPPAECTAVGRALASAGRSVDTVVFEGVTHGFDQRDHSPDNTLQFDAIAAREAIARAVEMLERVAESPVAGDRADPREEAPAPAP